MTIDANPLQLSVEVLRESVAAMIRDTLTRQGAPHCCDVHVTPLVDVVIGTTADDCHAVRINPLALIGKVDTVVRG